MPKLDTEVVIMLERSLEEQEAAENERLAQVEAFGQMLLLKLHDAIRARAESGIERRWSQDLDLYHGMDGTRASKDGDIFEAVNEARGGKQKRRSRVFVQVTRQKTNAASARLSDMLFPTNDRNWEIAPTPVPKLTNALKDHGNVAVRDPQPGPTQGQVLPHPTEDRPLNASDVISATLQEARRKANAMQSEIDDQLTECNFNREGRKAIRDAAKMGVGILKGPIVVNKVCKRWKPQRTSDGKQVHQLAMVEEIKPISERVDPWNFYPARGCGEDISKAGYIWERELVSRSDLKDLALAPSYSRDAILQCLRDGPKHISEAINSERERYGTGYVDLTGIDKANFELWTYVGEVLIEDLAAFGADLNDDDLELKKLSAIVVMCNQKVIKAVINPMDTGDHPYDVFSWESMDGSWAGVGIPYLMRYGQVTLNAAWRQMQDNAGVTHGPQIVMNRALVGPADGNWEIHGMKLWETKSQVGDVRTAFQVFQIDDRQQSLQRIIELALKFIDEETALPMIAQGERGSAPDKVGVVTLLMNSANTVLKQIARNWDDYITNPHITRYYDWNMQFSEKEEIKGDYSVKARGSTALVVRDQQKQDVMMLANMAGSPTFGKFINPQRLAKYAIEASSIADVMNTTDEIAQIEKQMAEAGPQEAPQIAVAKIRAEADLNREKITAQSEAANIQLKAQSMAADDQRDMMEMNLKRDLMVLEYALKKELSLQDVKAELAMMAMSHQADRKAQDDAAMQDIVKQNNERMAALTQ